MSYVRPLLSAADATWLGATPYTRPPANAADASWLTGFSVSGFCSTKLGIPSTPLPAQGFLASRYGIPSLAMVAQGFRGTQYGTPETLGYYQAASLGVVAAPGIPQREMVASGLLSAQVGIASTPSPAVGTLVTQFGAPRSWQHWQHRSLPPTTFIPGAFSPVHDTGLATGGEVARFGHHTGFVTGLQPIGWVSKASGLLVTTYGMASTARSVDCHARGSLVTRYGMPSSTFSMYGVITRYSAPVSRTSHAATGIPPAIQVGAATGVSIGRAQGWRATQFGTPVNGITCAATGRLHIHFGEPGSSRTGVYQAWACYARARFGQPRAWQRYNYPTFGFCGTAVGAPTAMQRHHALHAAPSSRIGIPTLVRVRAC